MSKDAISIAVREEDALACNADVLALKFAHSLHGLDRAVSDRLRLFFPDALDQLYRSTDSLFLATGGAIGPRAVLYVRVPPLGNLSYSEIRLFAERVLVLLDGEAPDAEHVALTLHGAGYGLDETEAFRSEIAGLFDALQSGRYPGKLRRISFVENNPARALRLQRVLHQVVPSGSVTIDAKSGVFSHGHPISEDVQSAGPASEQKPLVFVAMPFDKSMDDTFHYGIEKPIHEAGFLCERADHATFTGNVMEWVKRRILASRLVVADLTMANPNVYLEVGYAWGANKQTILLVRDGEEIKFDVCGDRCLFYDRIVDLEKSLRRELAGLFG